MPGKKTKLGNDPQLWRRRASEAAQRAHAEPDPNIKHRLEGIAKSYEAMAEIAEKRARGNQRDK
jgi:hypothetical protein